MIKVLLVGSGAREHAIAEAAKRNPKAELYSYMSARNPGIAKLSKEVVVGNTNDAFAISRFARLRQIDIAVIGPEAPLEAGVANALESVGIKCAAPLKAAARIEWDKAFARSLMKKHKIKGLPAFGVFTSSRDASAFIDSIGKPVAVKPAGLTGGKGVKVVGAQLKDNEDAKKYAREVLKGNIGKLKTVVVEEKLEGEEFTLQAFVDGTRVLGTHCVQDYKLAFEGDAGPNTGGMGSYSDAGYILPFMRQSDYYAGIRMMEDAVDALKKDAGVPYRGFLYGGFIATGDGLKLIEFNSRLGDPEAMNILPIMQSDFIELLFGIASGSLKSIELEKKATVCKYIVPEGYPDNPKKNEMINVNASALASAGARFYYASVDERDNNICMSGSRAVALLGIGKTIADAEAMAERATQFVSGPVYHRRDIGTQELIQKRLAHMSELRAKAQAKQQEQSAQNNRQPPIRMVSGEQQAKLNV